MHGWQLLLSVFGVIFVAELPDKTALVALALATRRRSWPVFAGAASALTVQSLVAVAAGQFIALLPARPVHVLAGAVFVASAVVMWLRKDADEETSEREGASSFWPTTRAAFVVVFLAEWGDLTQLATAALAARYRSPGVVFAGATLALWAVLAIAVFVGSRAGELLDPVITKRVAAALFGAIGLALIAGVL